MRIIEEQKKIESVLKDLKYVKEILPVETNIIIFKVSNVKKFICFILIYLFSSQLTLYMENKSPIYGSMFPDNRNFCSRLSFLFEANKSNFPNHLN